MRWNLAMAGLAASWGLIAVLVAAVDLDATVLAFARLALAALTLLAVAVIAGRSGELDPGDRLLQLCVLGAIQGAHWLLFFEAVKLGSVALAVLTFYTAPIVIALAAPVVLGERLSNVALGSLALGAVGIALVATSGDEGGAYSAIAIATGLGSAVTYAALVLLTKRLLAVAVAPLTVAFWDCLAGAVVVAPFLLGATRVLPSGREWGVVLLLGVVFTGLSTLAYTVVLRRVSAHTAGILTFLEPVAAVLLAAVLLDDRLGTAVLVGGALVLAAGVAVVMLEPTTVRVTGAPPSEPVGSDPS